LQPRDLKRKDEERALVRNREKASSH
jgi:hypothetical protein